jgi:hypothetical protein
VRFQALQPGCHDDRVGLAQPSSCGSRDNALWQRHGDRSIAAKHPKQHRHQQKINDASTGGGTSTGSCLCPAESSARLPTSTGCQQIEEAKFGVSLLGAAKRTRTNNFEESPHTSHLQWPESAKSRTQRDPRALAAQRRAETRRRDLEKAHNRCWGGKRCTAVQHTIAAELALLGAGSCARIAQDCARR